MNRNELVGYSNCGVYTIDIDCDKSKMPQESTSYALQENGKLANGINHIEQPDNKIIIETDIQRDEKPPESTSCYDNAPDGGWGWVVTFSAFMVGVILDGISFSFGLFFNHLLAEFSASKSQTSWIISVFNGTYLGIGR